MRRTGVPIVQMGLVFLLAFAVFSLSGAAGPLSVRPVHALTGYTVSGTLDSTTCTPSVGATWNSGNSTCTIPHFVDWYIASSLTIPSGTTLDNNGSIHDTDSIFSARIFNYGTITNEAEGFVDNCVPPPYYSLLSNIYSNGTFTNENTLRNCGDFTNAGTLANSGTILTQGAGYFLSSGTLTNSGHINNEGGYFENSGTFTNEAFGVINEWQSYSQFDNTGVLTNQGTFTNDGGFTNRGTFTNYGNMTNEYLASITNEFGAAIYNFGTIDNMLGKITSYSSDFDNECGGVIIGYTGYTQLTCPPVGAPEFPAVGPLLLTVLVFPVLLIATRRFRKTSAGEEIDAEMDSNLFGSES